MKRLNDGLERLSELWGSTDGIKDMLRRYGVARVQYPVDSAWVSHISKETGCYYKCDNENRTLWFATKEMALKRVDTMGKKALDNLIDLNLLAARATEGRGT